MKEVKDLDAEELGIELATAMISYIKIHLKTVGTPLYKIKKSDFEAFVCGFSCTLKAVGFTDDEPFIRDMVSFAQKEISARGYSYEG